MAIVMSSEIPMEILFNLVSTPDIAKELKHSNNGAQFEVRLNIYTPSKDEYVGGYRLCEMKRSKDTFRNMSETQGSGYMKEYS
jgi:hypothetical protein